MHTCLPTHRLTPGWEVISRQTTVTARSFQSAMESGISSTCPLFPAEVTPASFPTSGHTRHDYHIRYPTTAFQNKGAEGG